MEGCFFYLSDRLKYGIKSVLQNSCTVRKANSVDWVTVIWSIIHLMSFTRLITDHTRNDGCLKWLRNPLPSEIFSTQSAFVRTGDLALLCDSDQNKTKFTWQQNSQLYRKWTPGSDPGDVFNCIAACTTSADSVEVNASWFRFRELPIVSLSSN